MNKKSSINSLIYLMFIGMLTKIISMSSRIILSRDLGVNAVSINSLVNPLFVFGINIASFSLPTTISTLVAKKPEKGKKIVFTSLGLAFILNTIIVFLLFIFSKNIAVNLLHNEQTFLSIKLLTIVIPLTSISSIIKGYFIGKKEVELTSTSSLVEECSRLLSCIFISGIFYNCDDSVKATFFVFVMIIGEIIQTLFLVLTSGKKYIIKIKKFKSFFHISNYEFSEVIKISFPLTLSRVLTSFAYMLEPIVITTMLIRNGYSSSDITIEYGIISSYVMPLLMFPGFFSLAISNYLLPNLSSLTSKNQYQVGKKLFNQSLLICLIIGFIISIIFFAFGPNIIKMVYHVDFGGNEIRLLAIPFVIYYLETPINMAMHALNLTKQAFFSSLYASILRFVILILLTENYGVFTICIATLSACYFDVITNYSMIRNVFKRNNI